MEGAAWIPPVSAAWREKVTNQPSGPGVALRLPSPGAGEKPLSRVPAVPARPRAMAAMTATPATAALVRAGRGVWATVSITAGPPRLPASTTGPGDQFPEIAPRGSVRSPSAGEEVPMRHGGALVGESVALG